ncbi:hypothetical protein KY361_04575 [Candidatus Woesearchaeota archaeon]|nr:hypothetical protein [Candidatus Woesearchaeota archaeon]
MNKKGAFGEKKLPLDIEIIIGLIILAFGALLLLDFYKYLPRDFFIPKEIIIQGAGISSVLAGLVFTLKKLIKRESAF